MRKHSTAISGKTTLKNGQMPRSRGLWKSDKSEHFFFGKATADKKKFNFDSFFRQEFIHKCTTNCILRCVSCSFWFLLLHCRHSTANIFMSGFFFVVLLFGAHTAANEWKSGIWVYLTRFVCSLSKMMAMPIYSVCIIKEQETFQLGANNAIAYAGVQRTLSEPYDCNAQRIVQ